MASASRGQQFLISFIVHLLFLTSIFDLYFKSEVVEPLVHHKPGYVDGEAPAKRVVLIVADGVQADSFFENGIEATPFLRSRVESQGVWGVSLTSPSRDPKSGFLSMLAGMDSKAMSIFGWKNEPADFDSVIRQASYSYLWGDPDVVSMLRNGDKENRSFGKTYDFDPYVDRNTMLDLAKLDDWVFDHVKRFFMGSLQNDSRLNSTGLLFLIHLPGGGHVSMPYSEEYPNSLKLIDSGVRRTAKVFDEFFNDTNTAYIFTSNHGMTNSGTWGRDYADEVETPFVAWGSGIRNIIEKSTLSPQDPRALKWKLQGLEMENLNQVDIAPMIAALLDLNMPANSLGKLPTSIMRISNSGLIKAMIANVLQVHEQVLGYQRFYGDTILTSEAYGGGGLDLPAIMSAVGHVANLQKKFEHQEAKLIASDLFNICEDGLKFYRNYHQFPIFVSMVAGYLFYITFTVINLLRSSYETSASDLNIREAKWLRVYIGIGSTLAALHTFLQNVPYHYLLYYLTPIMLSYLAFKELLLFKRSRHPLIWNDFQRLAKTSLMVIVVLETLVLSFYNRLFLCLAIVLSMTWQLISDRSTTSRTMKISWLAITFILTTVVYALSVTSYKSIILVLWASGLSFGLSMMMFNKVSNKNKNQATAQAGQKCAKIILGPYNLLAGICSWITYKNLDDDDQAYIKDWSQYTAWFIMVSALPIAILFTPKILGPKLTSLSSALMAIYLLLSLSFEGLFLLCLIVTLFLWMALNTVVSRKPTQTPLQDVKDSSKITNKELTIAAMYLTLTLITMLATDTNVVDFNSFNTESVRVLVVNINFHEGLVYFLYLIKIFLPLLVLSLFANGVQKVSRIKYESLISLIVLFSDLIAFQLFLLIGDENASQLQESISNYLIIEGISLITPIVFAFSRILIL